MRAGKGQADATCGRKAAATVAQGRLSMGAPNAQGDRDPGCEGNCCIRESCWPSSWACWRAPATSSNRRSCPGDACPQRPRDSAGSWATAARRWPAVPQPTRCPLLPQLQFWLQRAFSDANVRVCSRGISGAGSSDVRRGHAAPGGRDELCGPGPGRHRTVSRCLRRSGRAPNRRAPRRACAVAGAATGHQEKACQGLLRRRIMMRDGPARSR